jgi:hypothetical protein
VEGFIVSWRLRAKVMRTSTRWGTLWRVTARCWRPRIWNCWMEIQKWRRWWLERPWRLGSSGHPSLESGSLGAGMMITLQWQVELFHIRANERVCSQVVLIFANMRQEAVNGSSKTALVSIVNIVLSATWLWNYFCPQRFCRLYRWGSWDVIPCWNSTSCKYSLYLQIVHACEQIACTIWERLDIKWIEAPFHPSHRQDTSPVCFCEVQDTMSEVTSLGEIY